MKDTGDANDKTTKDVTLSVFLDLSKAFDTINHDILVKKLIFYGIRGVPNYWFANYLSNRKQFTEINNCKSALTNVSTGVPQGSILGPILFLLYINDIHNCTLLNLLSFADDTTISKVTVLQKRAIRIFNQINYRGHTDPLFKSEKILKITDLYKLHVSLFMFDLQSGSLPTSFKQFVPRSANNDTSTIITRQHDNIQRQRPIMIRVQSLQDSMTTYSNKDQ